MVCRQKPPHHHRRRAPMFVGRSPLLHVILSGKKNHFCLRRQRSNISKKEQKGLILRPCSVKMSSFTKEEQTNVREVSMEQERKEKMVLMEDEMNIKEVLHELPGIPRIPSNNGTKSGIIFIFEMASLVPALVGKTFQILNPDDHANFLRRHKKNPYDYRPEIIHQALLEAPPWLQLLQKFSVKATGKRGKILRLIANPVTQHLPPNCYKIGLSYSSEKRVRLKDYVNALNDDVNLVFVVGAMAHGKINCDYTDEVVSGNTLLNCLYLWVLSMEHPGAQHPPICGTY
ncbi:hypothetical protein OROGR_029121 [Orobanche gracilis]